MITDQETNHVYLSSLITKYEEFYKQFISILSHYNIGWDLLSKTKDIWCRDYMPIQKDRNTFIQFKYKPDYLQEERYINLQTNPDSVCKAIGIKTIKSDIVLDGGNIIKGENWVILTDKIYKENPNYTQKGLIEKLEELLDIKVIIIPQEPGDYTGHADGILRWYNDHTVLLNQYPTSYCPRFQKLLKRTLTEAEITPIEIPYALSNKNNADKVHGLYINYLQIDKLVIVPTFGLREDENALAQFEILFPNHTIEYIDARVISAQGGVLNCITWATLIHS